MKEMIVVIPAFNEELMIKQVLLDLQAVCDSSSIVVLDDGSTDRTAIIARELGIKVISHPTNLGYAATIHTGFRYALMNNYEVVLFYDGDGQHDPTSILNMMYAMKGTDVDVVIGSRFLQQSDMKVSLDKMMAIRLFRFIIYMTTKTKITDPTSGFKAYHANVYKEFAKCDAFTFDLPDSNFIIDLLMKKYNVIETPVNMFERAEGESKIHMKGIKPFIYMTQMLLSIFSVIWRNSRMKIGGS